MSDAHEIAISLIFQDEKKNKDIFSCDEALCSLNNPSADVLSHFLKKKMKLHIIYHSRVLVISISD